MTEIKKGTVRPIMTAYRSQQATTMHSIELRKRVQPKAEARSLVLGASATRRDRNPQEDGDSKQHEWIHTKPWSLTRLTFSSSHCWSLDVANCSFVILFGCDESANLWGSFSNEGQGRLTVRGRCLLSRSLALLFARARPWVELILMIMGTKI